MRRPLMVLFALWFATVLGDPGMLHTCAMHGAGHGAHATQPAMSHDMHDMAGMDHGGHTAPVEQHDHAPGPCTCVGHCCAVTVAAPPTGRPTIIVADLAPAPSVVSSAGTQDAPAPPDRLLPFANGPPAI